MDNYKDLLDVYDDTKKKAGYSPYVLALFRVRKNGSLNLHYMYETVIKLKLITGKFSLPKNDLFHFDSMTHSDVGNVVTYESIESPLSVTLSTMIDDMVIPDKYKMRLDIPFLEVVNCSTK